MEDKYFTEKDKEKVIEFLNFITNNATFELKTQQVISYFKMLSYMQQTLLPKIDKNILEVKRVLEAEEEVKEDSTEG